MPQTFERMSVSVRILERVHGQGMIICCGRVTGPAETHVIDSQGAAAADDVCSFRAGGVW